MRTLRTPDERFENLPGWTYEPRYVEIPDGDGGTLRVHYVDEGPADAPPILCLHGEPSWAYLYRKMIPVLTAAGHRVRRARPRRVRPQRQAHRARRLHLPAPRRLDDLVARTPSICKGATLVCQDWGGLIGLRLVAENPDRFDRIVVANTFLPTGDAPAGEAFLNWQGVLADDARLPRRRHHQGRLPHAALGGGHRGLQRAVPRRLVQGGGAPVPRPRADLAGRSRRGPEQGGVEGAREVGEARR